MPLNLLFFLLNDRKFSPDSVSMDQTSSGSSLNLATYHKLYGKGLTLLSQSQDPMQPILERASPEDLELLNLEGLTFQRRQSPPNLFCTYVPNQGPPYRCKIKQFPITQFKFKSPEQEQKWLDSFRKYHPEILKRVGLENLFRTAIEFDPSELIAPLEPPPIIPDDDPGNDLPF